MAEFIEPLLPDSRELLSLAVNIVDFVHAFGFSMANIILFSEALFDVTMPMLNTYSVMRRHEMPSNREVSNLEHFWFRTTGAFRAPLAIVQFLGILGYLSLEQRKMVWFILVLHHFFDAVFIHLTQLCRPTPLKGFISTKRHRIGATLGLLACLVFSLLFLFYE